MINCQKQLNFNSKKSDYVHTLMTNSKLKYECFIQKLNLNRAFACRFHHPRYCDVRKCLLHALWCGFVHKTYFELIIIFTKRFVKNQLPKATENMHCGPNSNPLCSFCTRQWPAINRWYEEKQTSECCHKWKYILPQQTWRKNDIKEYAVT